MEQLNALSNRFIVMAERGRELLKEVYGVLSEKIDLIPHGVPDVQFIDPSFHKDQFGVEGKTMLLTFGLLSPNKGIEYVIEALPAILEKHPNVVYIVLGATHPNLLSREGESYRLKLERLAEDRGVSANVIFYNRFVTLEELTDFIGAADIYVTPYLNEAQITSGTLAYAFGAGKAVISTPYLYAQELLAQERGILVPFRDSNAIAEAVSRLLSNPALMTGMRKRAWQLGREMIWPVVAGRYMESFQRARVRLTVPPRKAFAVRTLENRPYEFLPLKLDHLFRMTDNTGIFQHAIFNVPNYREGYCTDDNARAFILTLLLPEMTSRVAQRDVDRLASTYLSFLWDAFDQETKRFRNFMIHSRQWFESFATYDNAKLSHAMILSGHWTSRGEVFQAGLQSLRWLVETQRAKTGHFAPIGSNGFWKRGGERARFDQQPVEAYATISACLEAFALTHDEYWKRASRRCFEWFLGRNDLGESLYDSSTGGCRDALHQDRVSQNQGAESSLAFYLSLAEMTQAETAPDLKIPIHKVG